MAKAYIALLFFVIMTVPILVTAQILNSNIGFENGTLTGWRNNNDGHPTSVTRIVASPHPVRTGNRSLLLEAHADDRNEIILSEDPAVIFHDGEEYWLGESIFLKEYSKDYLAWSSIMQMHTVPGDFNWKCNTPPNTWTLYTGHPDGDSNPANLSIGFAVWHSAYGPFDPYTIPPTGAAIGRDSPWKELVSDNTNRWIDIVVNWIPSSNDDGFIKCWINGELVVDLNGPNLYYYDRCGVPREPFTYFQTGIYKEQSQSDIKRAIYIDEIRIAGADASYDDVAPKGKPLNTPPVMKSIENQIVKIDNVRNIFVTANDPDRETLSYSLSPKPQFITLIDDGSGIATLRISPGKEDSGIYEITVTVTDSNKASDSETIIIEIK